MSHRTISPDQLSEIAMENIPDFITAYGGTLNIYRIIAMSFTIITKYCRIYDPDIKSSKRCELAKEYIPILLAFLCDRNHITEDIYENLLREYHENTDILEILRSNIFILKNLSIVQSPEKHSKSCCCL